jgi:hypothetical protein
MGGVALLSLTTVSGSAPVRADEDSRGRHGSSKDTVVFTVDVAEDFAKFVPTKVKPEDTQPERGAFFVTEGNASGGVNLRVTFILEKAD